MPPEVYTIGTPSRSAFIYVHIPQIDWKDSKGISR